MGYCAKCEGDIELKNGVSEERFAEIKNILNDIYEVVIFHNDIGINDNKFFVCHDDKYYEDETLEALRKIVNDVEKAKIDYSGEDGQEWAFTIKNGNIYELTGLGRDESSYKDSTLIYGEEKGKEPNTVKTLPYVLETSPDVIMEYAFSKKTGLDLEDMLLEELWNNNEYFIDSLMDNVLFNEPFLIKYECEDEDYDDVRDELKNKIYDVLSELYVNDWGSIISISDYENYDIDISDNRVQIWTSVDIDMEKLYKSIVCNLTNDKIKDVSVKDISWINGEFKVETTEGEKFTIHKDGSVTIDDEMESVTKENKPKNKGYER